MSAKNDKDKTVPRWLTARRLQMLLQLERHGCLGAGEMHQLVDPSKSRSYTSKDLAALEENGCVKRFRLKPSEGASSEFGYQLTQKGASQIGVKLGSEDRREPSTEKLEWQRMVRELERAVESAGWLLIKKHDYNSSHPVPEYTPQYLQLARALKVAAGYELRQELEGYAANRVSESLEKRIQWYLEQPPRCLGLPGKVNDYVVYPPDQLTAVVLILPRPNASTDFWQNRINKYSRIAKELFVFGVFNSEEQALQYKPLLNEHNLRVTTLKQVVRVLNWVANPPLPFGRPKISGSQF